MGLWWVPIGLAAWFGIAVVAALFIGPALRRGSEAREALEQQLKEMPGGYESSQACRGIAAISSTESGSQAAASLNVRRRRYRRSRPV